MNITQIATGAIQERERDTSFNSCPGIVIGNAGICIPYCHYYSENLQKFTLVYDKVVQLIYTRLTCGFDLGFHVE